ncbi:S-adenosyl-L-methionine-dependent methyltransferase [Geopyxis carbonaria]|nr:S-adenosyl-L-methionine-dependent methyltransferase [Geopyxis carbonaria]
MPPRIPHHPLLRHARPATVTPRLRPTPGLISRLTPSPQCRPHSASTVDANEVSHFNALAAQWWDAHGSSRLLHLMNPLRLAFLRSCLARGPPLAPTASTSPSTTSTTTAASPGLRYLDVGCGGGILAESLARLQNTREVVGIDPTAGVLAIAREHMRRDPALVGGRLRYLESTIGGLREALKKEGEKEGGMFDVVTTMEVLEHVPDPPSFLSACMTHVKPGGWLVGSTIARSWVSYVTTIAVAEHVLGIVPPGTHDWNKYVNADELRKFFGTQAGWGEVTFRGCAFVPGLGWREVPGGERVGNYFFAVRRLPGAS